MMPDVREETTIFPARYLHGLDTQGFRVLENEQQEYRHTPFNIPRITDTTSSFIIDTPKALSMFRGLQPTIYMSQPIGDLRTLTLYDVFRGYLIQAAPFITVHSTTATPSSVSTNWLLLATALNEESYLSIRKLAQKKAGWRGAGSHPLNAASLTNFLRFWKTVSKYAVDPEFSLVPNGNLQAEWYKDEAHFLELEFRSDNYVLFGLFDHPAVIEGIEHADNIIPMLAQRDNKSLMWKFDEKKP